MTHEKTPITSRTELNEVLQAVLLEAYENGVTVRGGFDCRNGPDHPDWDVIVTEVEKNEPSE